MATLPSLAIIVVNYGSHGLLGENLVPLAGALPGTRVVVVDNFSTELERDAVLELGRREGWDVIASASNKGFGAGMNIGVTRAREFAAERFLLLNPDLSISPDDVRRLHDASATEPMTMLSPRILRPDGSEWFHGADLYLDDGRIRAVRRRSEYPAARREEWLSGACLMVSAGLWESVGGFAEEYFLYWEDVDLSHRVHKAGGSLRVEPDATAIHAEGGTQGVSAEGSGTPKSATYYRYSIRNRLLFASRNLTAEDMRRWRSSTLSVAWEVLLQGGRRQLLRGWPIVAAGRGIAAGLGAVRRELRHARTTRPTRR